MKIFKLISIADIFTTINALLGLTSIFATMSGWYFFAINLIMLGVISDGVDGVFARRFSKKWYLGDYLDLMSDTVTFCIAPSVLMFDLFFEPAQLSDWTVHILDLHQAPFLILAGCGAIVVSGILRLARFSYQTPFMGNNFIGIPTPSVALTMSLLIMLDLRLTGNGAHQWAISPSIIGILALVLSFLMISDIRYLKLKGRIEWIAGGLVLLAIILNDVMAVILMVYMASIIYIVGGPFALRSKEKGKGENTRR